MKKKVKKRLLAGISALSLTCMSLSPGIGICCANAGEGTILYGDANNDGNVDYLDAAAVQAFSIGAYTEEGLRWGWYTGEFNFEAADVVQDGVINSLDAAAIQKFTCYYEEAISLPIQESDPNWYNAPISLEPIQTEYHAKPGDTINLDYQPSYSEIYTLQATVSCGEIQLNNASTGEVGALVENNMFSIVSLDSTRRPFTSTDRKFELSLSIPEDCAAGSYTVHWDDIVAGNYDGQTVESVDVGEVTVIVADPATEPPPTEPETAAPSATEPEGPFIPWGDVNGDLVLNSVDAALIQRIAVGNYAEDYNFEAADVVPDGVINSFDAAAVMARLMGAVRLPVKELDPEWDPPSTLSLKAVFSGIGAEPGDEIELSYCLDRFNGNPLTGIHVLQAAISCDGLRLTKAEAGKRWGMVNSENNMFSIAAYPSSVPVGVEGDIITLTLTVPEDCKAGSYTVHWDDILAGNYDGQLCKSFEVEDVEIAIVEPPAPPTEPEPDLYGDADSDGSLSFVDVNCILERAARTYNGSVNFDSKAADVVPDGVINCFDASALLSAIMWNETLPVKEPDPAWTAPSIALTAEQTVYDVHPGAEIEVKYRANSNATVPALQADISCGDLRFSSVSTMLAATYSNDMRFAAASSNNDPSFLADGITLRFSIPKDCEAGTYTICWENILAGNYDGQLVKSFDVEEVTVNVSETLYGDVNMDGKVNANDAERLMFEIAQSFSEHYEYYSKYADVVPDGVIDGCDAAAILKACAETGNGNSFPLPVQGTDPEWKEPYLRLIPSYLVDHGDGSLEITYDVDTNVDIDVLQGKALFNGKSYMIDGFMPQEGTGRCNDNAFVCVGSGIISPHSKTLTFSLYAYDSIYDFSASLSMENVWAGNVYGQKINDVYVEELNFEWEPPSEAYPETLPPVPDTTAPATTAPNTTAPATTVPDTTAPATTVPDTTAPATTVPDTTAPATTVPDTTAPATTVPDTTAPATTVPDTTAPATTVPDTTAPATEHIASDDELCQWAVNDYQQKTGITAESVDLAVNKDGTYEITLADKSGNVMEVYVIDPVSGKGTDTLGNEIKLPQTGNNAIGSVLLFFAAFICIGIGGGTVIGSGRICRKKDN